MVLQTQRSMFRDQIPDLWYKDAIMYEMDVETFYDSNGDGVGDFAGLARRLDYLSSLGITCLWLLPFFPTPNRDNGYDISDFYDIDPRLGSLGEFVEFMHLASERGIRVLADLVVNHTSDQHPWFQQSRRDKNSPYRDYYIWSKERPENYNRGMAMPGPQQTTWTYDEVAGEWYFHRFFSFQPDLNIENPAVREEIRKIVGFWLQLGVSGFRVDAVPYLIEQPGVDRELVQLREFLSWRRGDAILLAEADVDLDDAERYFGDGTKMHMLFNFRLTEHMWASLANNTAEPLLKFLPKLPELSETSQWANFLRNHDECNLGRLSDDLREKTINALAHADNAQIFGRGLRRRIAPMLGGDVRRIKLAHSLLMSMAGTPVIRYGSEIGMGDDLSLEGRTAVRTPMQWANHKNGGFSTADRDKLVRPVIDSGPYGYQHVNVAEQRRDPDSLLSWMQALIRVRKECPEIGRGNLRIIDVENPAVLAHRFDWSDGAVIMLHNFSDQSVDVLLDKVHEENEYTIDLFGENRFKHVSLDQPLQLEAYGYRWLRVAGSEWELP